EPWMEELYRRVSDRQTMGSVVQELRASLGEVEKSIDTFFRNPADHGVLVDVPTQLASMRGVLSVLGMDQAAQALLRMRDEVDGLVSTEIDPDRVGQAGVFQRLAGNLSALGFMIDMLSVQPHLAKSLFVYDAEAGTLAPVMGRSAGMPEQPAPVEPRLIEQAQLLAFSSVREDVPLQEVTRDLERLSHEAQAADQPTLAAAVLKAQESLLKAADDPVKLTTARGELSEALVDFVATSTEPASLEPVVAEPAPAPMKPIALVGELEHDEEMRDVFLEEAREVIDDAKTATAELQEAPGDLGLLTTVRRAFHTLKGSSRMVGLKAFGEAAWACEQLFNTQLAEQRAVEAPLLEFTTWVLDHLAAWVDDIAGHRDEGRSEGEVKLAADRVARRLQSGEESSDIALPMGLPADLPSRADLELGQPAAPVEPVSPPAEVAFELDLSGLDSADASAPQVDNLPALDVQASAMFDRFEDARDDDAMQTTLANEQFRPEPHAGASIDLDLGNPTEPAALFEALAPSHDDHRGDGSGPSSLMLDLSSGEALPAATLGSSGSVPLDLEIDAPAPAQEYDGETPGATEEHVKVVGPLRIGIPLFNIYLNEADELSRRLMTEVAEWAMELHRPPGETPIALAHSLAGSSATVGFADLSHLARTLEHALARTQVIGHGTDEEARLFVNAAEEIRRLLHQFAAGFLKEPSPELVTRLADHEVSSAMRLEAITAASELAGGADSESPALPGPAVEPLLSLDDVEPVGAPSPSISLSDEASDAGPAATSRTPVSDEAKAPHPVADTGTRFGADGAHDGANGDALSSTGSASDTAAIASHPSSVAEPSPATPIMPTPSAASAEDRSSDAHPAPDAPTRISTSESGDALAATATDDDESPDDPFEAAVSSFGALGPLGALGRAELKPLAAAPTEPARPAQAARASTFGDVDDDIDAVDAVDLELFPIFEEEAQELLPKLAGQLRDWSRQPAVSTHASACMRTLHTLKGGARLAGAMRLGEMAHRLETRIERLTANEGKADASDVETLQGRADAMAHAFDALRNRDAQAYADAVAAAATPDPLPVRDAGSAARAAAVAAPPTSGPDGAAPSGDERSAPPSSAPATPEPAAWVAAAPSVTPVPATGAEARKSGKGRKGATAAQDAMPSAAAVAAGTATASSAPIDWSRFTKTTAAVPAKPQERAQAAAQSAVRVRAPLLDRLVNQAGEVSITRSRIESGVSQIKGSLTDLTENLERLRGQLRDIELQGEVQMTSRLEAAKAASQAFDPLEFDRFTRFQELTRMMAESVNDVATVQRTLQRSLETAEDELVAQARLTRDLQDDLLRTRMVEFEGLSDRLYRVVRLAAKETGKQVRLDIVGGSIEVDRGVLDRMTGAFEHLLRNCVSHGIEAPDKRIAAGKDATGTIVVSLSQEGNEVGVEFRDDGAGLDLARIRDKGVAMRLLDPGHSHDDAELANLIFTAGFTTVDNVTELAGRGVGMDVVRSDVIAMGGRIETATAAGQGTSFKLILPLTTAVTQVVMLRCGDNRIAVPSTLVEIVRRATPKEVQAAYASGVYEVGDATLPFFWLG
ncbi:MAG TPA: Hpt domain-containing protein, partial [Caldimonas sp.]|nr:Hpt domain-containing protein [Caldimonas sp.]